YTLPFATTGDEYPIRSWSSANPSGGLRVWVRPVRFATTSDFQTSAPVLTFSAHNRPLPQAALTHTDGAGAPEMTTLIWRLKNQNQGTHTFVIVADDAIPGEDALPVKFCVRSGCPGPG